MIPVKTIAALSFSVLAISPLAIESKADDYEKSFYGSIGIGSGTFSDLFLEGTPFASAFEPGFSYDASLGYDFGKHFRVDVSFTNTTSTTANDKESQFGSIMLNGYLDFPINDTKWTPFIGIGYGSTNIDAVNSCTPGGYDYCKDNVATSRLSTGLSYSLDSNMDITTEVTYLGLGRFTMTDDRNYVSASGSETIAAHIGLRFKF